MFRQEEKFFLNYKNLANILNHFKAYPIHPVRKVNSIYFDTTGFEFFNDGEEGIVPRKKCRFRWYGSSNKNTKNFGSIEIKTTLENYKKKQSLKKKTLFEAKKYFANYFKIDLFPTCQISYERAYYLNNHNYRFTFDYNIQFKKIGGNTFHKINQNIFEIKYSSMKNDNIILSNLADKKTRFSKYNEAILKLYLIN